jgi:hypothetical protein
MKRLNSVLSLVFLSLYLCPALALASYPVNQYPYVPPIENMQQNGAYIIFVEKEGNWQEAGKLTYDEFFREKAIDLSSYISVVEKIRIKIVQEGGGAAHIDSVFLGEKSPVEVAGVTESLKKLSKNDFDVIDAYGKSMDMEFPVNRGNNILKLTARVAGATISETPFLFPLDNLFKAMDKNAHFYTYRLNSRRGNVIMDGVLDETVFWEPLFREYYPSGSGHPSGFTYGWIWNDDENLYGAIDFTPDNTMDGDKDYAKIYINTDGGLKEFKVSEPDINWGRAAFSYSNKVGYQHKIYEFKMPFKEIVKGSIKSGDELQLAFSTYGTATPNNRPIIYCNGVATGDEPTINGVITAGEWPATPQLIIPSSTTGLLTYFYCMNNSTDLYILVNAIGDTTADSWCDECLLYFGFNGSTPVRAETWIHGSGNTGTEVPVGSGILAAIGFNNNRIYEWKIPLSAVSNPAPVQGQLIDFSSPLAPGYLEKYCKSIEIGGENKTHENMSYASMPYDGTTGKDNIWPPGLNFGYRNTWGLLQLDDGDGVSSEVENACTPDGDGNDDGTLDSLQNNVTSLPSATGQGCITLVSQAGCPLQNVQALTEQQAAALNGTQQDLLSNYPFGLVSFRIPCQQATVTIKYHGTNNLAGFTYRKNGPTPNNWNEPIWYDFSANATINGNEVTLTLCDGCLGDDTVVDGVIIDQGGAGQPGASVAVPTMTEWGMIIFMMLAGLGAIYYLRRNRKAER